MQKKKQIDKPVGDVVSTPLCAVASPGESLNITEKHQFWGEFREKGVNIKKSKTNVWCIITPEISKFHHTRGEKKIFFCFYRQTDTHTHSQWLRIIDLLVL